jgi:glycosyltransferase involved in cell wall biosynthesis
MNYVGAKRTLHFCRHLPTHGWHPAVVALPDTLERDEALVPLVPDVPMLRTLRGGPLAWAEDLRDRLKGPKSGWDAQYKAQAKQSKELTSFKKVLAEVQGAFAAMDRFAKYLPWALPGIVRFARAQRCQLIYASAGPFSALLLADFLRRALNLPMVLDLRDPWSLEPNYRASWTATGLKTVQALEQTLFAHAAKVILNTQASYSAHVEHYLGAIPAERFMFLRNQFDPDLYGPPGPVPSHSDPFRIIYYGHLRPTKNAGLFLGALKRFITEHALAPGQLEFITLGEVTPADAETWRALGLEPYIRQHGWLSFPDSPSLLGTADVLLDLMGPNHGLQISGKIYDYLAAGRPILSISPNTELDAVFAETGAGERVDLSEDAIVAALNRRFARPKFAPDSKGLQHYTAAAASATLARVFDGACGRNEAT